MLFSYFPTISNPETHTSRHTPQGHFSTGKHKTNHFILNSLNRQALTGIDQCSDGGMWMSHVFSIIYTALLFLSPPLRQVSILLHRNQSVICQTLSIRRLIYVSYCGWLHASVTAGKEQMGRGAFCQRHLDFTGKWSAWSWGWVFIHNSRASSSSGPCWEYEGKALE